MWFFRQAQQIPPTPQREVEQRIEPFQEQKVELRQVERQEPRIEVRQEPNFDMRYGINMHSGGAANAALDGASATEQKFEEAAWLVDVVRPLERRIESVAEENFGNLMDKNGWWKDDQTR